MQQPQARYCSATCGRYAQAARRGRFVIEPQRRRALYERDAWLCQLCGDGVDPTLPPSHEWAATLDHIAPRSLGGSDDDENLRLAHRWCNSVLGDGSNDVDGLFDLLGVGSDPEPVRELLPAG